MEAHLDDSRARLTLFVRSESGAHDWEGGETTDKVRFFTLHHMVLGCEGRTGQCWGIG